MHNIKFSVIIPLYNKEKHILRTIDSINNQKYPASEIIIIDDGSTDKGPELVAQSNFANVKLIRQENQGVSAARNNGAAIAENEYIAFLDADDQWLPLFLDETARLAIKYPQANFFGTKYQIVSSDGNYEDAKIHMNNINPEGVILDNYFEIAAKGDLPFTMSSMVIKQSLLKKIGGFPLNEPIGEDQDLFCRVALNGIIAYSPNIHSLYHKDAENQASVMNVPDKECAFSVRISTAAANTSDETKAKHMFMYSAAHLCHLAKLNIKNGKYNQGRELLADPRCKLKPKHKMALYCLSWLMHSKKVLTDLAGKQLA